MENVDVFIVDSSESETSKVDILRGIITEKLTTATREIFAVVEQTIVGYDKEVLMLKRELECYKRQLDTTPQPHVSPPPVEVNIVDGKEEDNDGKPVSNKEDDGARQETKEDEVARGETKEEDDGAREETKEDDGARQEDEVALRETKEDDGARKEDEVALRETKEDDGACQESKEDEVALRETKEDDGAREETEEDEVIIVGDVLINTSSSTQKPLNTATSEADTINYVQTVNRKKRRRHTHHAGTGPSNGASGQTGPAPQLNPDFFDQLWCAIPELSANPAFEALWSENQSSADLPATSGMEVTEPEPMDEQNGAGLSGSSEETPDAEFGNELLRGYVEKHMKIHAGEKPFSGTDCGKTFRSQQGRPRTVQPFCCPQCDYKSLRKDNLKVHMRTHTGEKPYICSFCNKAFAQNCSLKSHMKSHFPQLKYAK